MICAAPNCNRTLRDGNTAGLCRRHVHTKGLCKCDSCATGHWHRKHRAEYRKWRIVGRAELAAQGLLGPNPGIDWTGRGQDEMAADVAAWRGK